MRQNEGRERGWQLPNLALICFAGDSNKRVTKACKLGWSLPPFRSRGNDDLRFSCCVRIAAGQAKRDGRRLHQNPPSRPQCQAHLYPTRLDACLPPSGTSGHHSLCRYRPRPSDRRVYRIGQLRDQRMARSGFRSTSSNEIETNGSAEETARRNYCDRMGHFSRHWSDECVPRKQIDVFGSCGLRHAGHLLQRPTHADEGQGLSRRHI